MATQAEKLATSLEILSTIVRKSKRTVFRSTEFSRVHRERLVKSGFLFEIIKGWLLASDPHKRIGESTLWYSNFWNFLSILLEARFGNSYCLSAETSLKIHTGSTTIPAQVTVITGKSSGQTITLPFNTSLFFYQDTKNLPTEKEIKNDLQVMQLPEAICRLPKSFFEQHPVEAEVALSLIRDAGQLLHYLLRRGQTTTAGYLVGAYRHLGRDDIATNILESMLAAGHKISVENPFKKLPPILTERPLSPHASRLQALWHFYRPTVIEHFSKEPGLPQDSDSYLSNIDKHFINDAYNSLSIEGYNVSPQLIDKIRQGLWDPLKDSGDVEQKDALAAKGYQLAFEEVRHSVQKILTGNNPGKVAKEGLSRWYRALFSPAVQAGLLQEYHLAGYRSQQVYIQQSRHIPFPQTAILDSMDMLFELLEKEDHPAVRALLGHFFFVHIHPYSDGNGRIGRFLMNVMFASGGYPWVVIPVERRSEYMSALERASCENNIVDFVDFVDSLLKK